MIDLNRPSALNALNLEMVDTLLPLVRDWQTPGGDVKLAVLRGTGGKAFCAGGDIAHLLECALGKRGKSPAEAMTFFSREYALNNALGTSKIPFVAFWDGIVMGGGVGLSVHGAFRVATENTLFAMPETVSTSWNCSRHRFLLAEYQVTLYGRASASSPTWAAPFSSPASASHRRLPLPWGRLHRRRGPRWGSFSG